MNDNVVEITSAPRLDALLTQEEVNALPSGIIVNVVWPGSNSPQLYRIIRDGDFVRIDNFYLDILTFVGSETWQTHVTVPYVRAGGA